jgi:hypothetical protein
LRELSVAVKNRPCCQHLAALAGPTRQRTETGCLIACFQKVADFSDKSMLTIKIREALSDFDPNR